MMRTFRLKLDGEHACAGKEIEFEGSCPNSAIQVLRSESWARSAELWCEGRHVASIARGVGNSWLIAG